jgi:hypothetical protein
LNFDVKDCHYIRNKSCVIFGTVEGEWTKFLKFDNVLYWKSKTLLVAPKYKQDYTLPSDSGYREDLINFIDGDEARAQLIKEKYEEIQRRDRKLREQSENYHMKKN